MSEGVLLSNEGVHCEMWREELQCRLECVTSVCLCYHGVLA